MGGSILIVWIRWRNTCGTRVLSVESASLPLLCSYRNRKSKDVQAGCVLSSGPYYDYRAAGFHSELRAAGAGKAWAAWPASSGPLGIEGSGFMKCSYNIGTAELTARF